MRTVYKYLLWGVSGVSVLLGLGILYQNLKEIKDRKRFPTPGRIYTVDGLGMHAICQGQGTPTVVLVAGLGCTLLDWSYVMPEIAKNTRVFAYDRCGNGWSGPGQNPRTGLKMVAELRALLQKAGISGPIILVGHSYGAHMVRLYASQYPQSVAGIILVDGSPEDQRKYFPKTKPWRKRIAEDVEWQIYRLRPILARIGFIRLRKQPNGNINTLDGRAID
jgi:pimeloyl-ACP methyl ester carboxylesterase